MRKYRLAFAVALSGLLGALGTACSSKSHAPASLVPGAGAAAGADAGTGAGAGTGADSSEGEGGLGPLDPVEALATPVAFAAMSAQMDALPDAGADAGLPTDLSGTFTLGPGSNGIDLSRDRVVVVVGSPFVIEPGGFACTPAMTCTANGPSPWTAFQRVELSKQDATTYAYRISGAEALAAIGRFFLRIGDDWGGVDLTSMQPILTLSPALDTSRAVTATVGTGGGELAATDTSGVRISLVVPPGALVADTKITLTPLALSPFADDGRSMLSRGVDLEPSGLKLAAPASLVFDFSASGRAVTATQNVFLATSPLTMLLLRSHAHPAGNFVRGAIAHFSEYSAGDGAPEFEDLTAWADPILASHDQPSLLDALLLDQLYRMQQASPGCTQNCIDGAQVKAQMAKTLASVTSDQCTVDAFNPTDGSLDHWMGILNLAKSYTLQAPDLNQCVEQVLKSLIEGTATAGEGDPSLDKYLVRLDELLDNAVELGFSSEQTEALGDLRAVMSKDLDYLGTVVTADPNDKPLERLAFQAQKALQLQFADLGAKAAQEMDTGLRALVQRGKDDCANGRTLDGRGKLNRANAGVSSSVATIDASIRGEIATALAMCQDNHVAHFAGTITDRVVDASCGWPCNKQADGTSVAGEPHCVSTWITCDITVHGTSESTRQASFDVVLNGPGVANPPSGVEHIYSLSVSGDINASAKLAGSYASKDCSPTSSACGLQRCSGPKCVCYEIEYSVRLEVGNDRLAGVTTSSIVAPTGFETGIYKRTSTYSMMRVP